MADTNFPIEKNEVVPEQPGVVVGGPLDPNSVEGQPPEGHVVGTATPASTESYKGLTGELKTFDELKTYTKNLEDLVVSAKAAQAVQPLQAPNPQMHQPTMITPSPDAKQKFTDLIFSKPEEAYEVVLQEAERRAQEKNAIEQRKQAFWQNFYVQHQDLKNMDRIVQSIVRERSAEISQLRTDVEVSEFLSKETRKVVDLVKKETGFTETRVPSQIAVSLGGSRESVPTPPPAPVIPLNFTDQIRRLKPRGKK